eukprot:9490865-Pyramimonas_sp.AAC.1
MILDGANVNHFLHEHDSYTLEKEGKLTSVVAAELFEDHRLKAAKLATWFFCQPSGGSAARGFLCGNRLRADGRAQVEATYDELVSYWTDWCPIGNRTPKSVLGALPLAESFEKREFLPGFAGAGQGARHSLVSQEWRNFISTGSGHQIYLQWSEFHFFRERSQPYTPGLPPEGRAARRPRENIISDQVMEQAISALEGSQPAVQSPAGAAVRIVWRASETRPAARQTEQLQVETRGAAPTAGSAGSAAESPDSAGDFVGAGAAVSPAKLRARSVEPTQALAAESPPDRFERMLREKCREFEGGKVSNNSGAIFPLPGAD